MVDQHLNPEQISGIRIIDATKRTIICPTPKCAETFSHEPSAACAACSLVDKLFNERIFIPASEFRRAVSLKKTKFYERRKEGKLRTLRDDGATVIFQSDASSYVHSLVNNGTDGTCPAKGAGHV
jgi:hypothetical protein